MPKQKTPQLKAAGRLILAIQKVENYRAGTEQAHEAHVVMNRAHDLHMAAGAGSILAVLGGKSIAQYLGADWVACHPGVVAAVAALEDEV
jgi:hypothetical protein